MNGPDQYFGFGKDRRYLRLPWRFLGSFFRVALLVMALGFHSAWNYGDPGVGPILLSERRLATSNTAYFVSAFGLSGSAALVATTFKVLRARVERRLGK